VIRKFAFEAEMHESLGCVPMPVRRKLDRAGLKVGLEQWRALSRGERLAICHLPAGDAEEIDALSVFVREAVARRCGDEPKMLSSEQRAIAEPPDAPPRDVIANARAAGFAVDAAAWARLDGDARYALVKLGSGDTPSHNLAAALRELLASEHA
jgi:hypothetical protein